MSQDEFELFAQVFGEGADLGNLRRLQIEATTLVIADLKSKVSSSSQPEATQLPAAEKAHVSAASWPRESLSPLMHLARVSWRAMLFCGSVLSVVASEKTN